MKHNGGKRPEQILAEIDHTRGELDRTLTAIEQRLTPGQLIDQGLDYMRHSGGAEFVQNLGGAAKQNPMPVALVGIGLAWLMALGRQPAQPGTGSSMSSSTFSERAGSMKERAGAAMQNASESMSGMKDRASEAMGSMRARASQVTGTTREQWHDLQDRARGSLDYLIHEQPLALGAIGVAVGALLGAAAPRTRAEEQMMGEAARNLAEKAKEVGSQQMDKAQQAVKQAAEQVTAGSKPQPAAGSKPQPQAQAQPQPPKQPLPQATRPNPGPTTPEKKGGW